MTIIETTQFSAQLREMTQEDHHAAESSDFITSLMGGQRSARDYALLIAQYHYIYAALEEEMRTRSEAPELKHIFDPNLERSEQITRDLEILLPGNGISQLPAILPATEIYVEAIRAAAVEPAQLIAHHYLRYLGDLSGGLAIGKMVSRHYGIPDEALNMWKFDSIAKPKLYKDAYREKLDDFGRKNPGFTGMVLDEAKRGFQLNKSMFEELSLHSSAYSGADS